MACSALVAERETLLGETIDLLETCKAECTANTIEQVTKVKNEAMIFIMGMKGKFEKREKDRLIYLGVRVIQRIRIKGGFEKWKTKTTKQ